MTLALGDLDALGLAPRELLVAEVSTPLDTGLVALWDGSRLRGCTSSSTLGLGFDACSFQLLTPGGGEWWPLDAAMTVLYQCFETCVLRLLANGSLVWAGRLWDCDLYETADESDLGRVCKVHIAARGFGWTELTTAPPELGPDLTDEHASPSLSTLLEALISGLWEREQSVIRPVFDRLQPSSTNLGPIVPQVQETALDLITNAIRVGNELGEEYAYLQYEPELGPQTVALCEGGTHNPPKWAVSIEGAGLALRGDEFASEVRAVYSDNDGQSEATVTIGDPQAAARHGGLPRARTIALNRIKAEAALEAVAAALALKSWPVALVGPLAVKPRAGERHATVRTAEGGRASAWLARAGDVVEVYDAPPQPDRDRLLAIVDQATMQWETGELSLQFDQRRITSRPGEDQGEIAGLRRILEPGQQFTFNRTWHSSAAQVINATGQTLSEPEISFTLPTPVVATVTVKIQGSPTADGIDQRFYHGFSVDNDAWDKDDFTRSAKWRTLNAAGASQVESAVFGGVRLSAGAHRVYVRVDDNGATIGEVNLDAVTVTIVAEVPRVTHQQVSPLLDLED